MSTFLLNKFGNWKNIHPTKRTEIEKGTDIEFKIDKNNNCLEQ